MDTRQIRIQQALVEWLATPEGLRDDPDLPALATRLGLQDTAELFVAGAGDASMNQALLQAAAGGVMHRMPHVLTGLVDAAEKGSVRAAEILLEFVRKTIQSHPSQMVAPEQRNVVNILMQMSEGTGALAQLTEALGSQPDDAADRLTEWRTQQALNARARATMLIDKPLPAEVEVIGEKDRDDEDPFVSRGT